MKQSGLSVIQRLDKTHTGDLSSFHMESSGVTLVDYRSNDGSADDNIFSHPLASRFNILRLSFLLTLMLLLDFLDIKSNTKGVLEGTPEFCTELRSAVKILC